jgi:hypothetical protein
MDQLNRRAMVRGILCGAAVVGVGLTLPPGVAEAMPIDASLANAPDGLIEDAQWSTQHWRHGSTWHGNIGIGVGAADGSAGGIADAAFVAGADGKGEGRAALTDRSGEPS